MVYIYGLRCPVDGGFRYVGKTTNTKTRLRVHLYDAKVGKYKHHTSNWIRSLQAEGMEPELVVLEECREETWQQAERDWIAKGKLLGWRLTNSTIGGEGTPNLPPESKASKSKKMKVAWSDDSYREKIINARNEPQFLKEQSKRLVDRWKDAEHRKKMTDARWPEEKRIAQAKLLLERKDKIQRAMTPEVRAKQGEKMKLIWAQRRLLKGKQDVPSQL